MIEALTPNQVAAASINEEKINRVVDDINNQLLQTSKRKGASTKYELTVVGPLNATERNRLIDLYTKKGWSVSIADIFGQRPGEGNSIKVLFRVPVSAVPPQHSSILTRPAP